MDESLTCYLFHDTQITIMHLLLNCRITFYVDSLVQYVGCYTGWYLVSTSADSQSMVGQRLADSWLI